jgi:hypothetical protein
LVAAQVLHLKKQRLETSFSLYRLKGCETRRFQAMGKLDSTCTQPYQLVVVIIWLISPDTMV